MQLHRALCICSPHLNWCKVDTSNLSSCQTCCTEGTTPKRVWQGALLECHPRWMHQRTYIPLQVHRKPSVQEPTHLCIVETGPPHHKCWLIPQAVKHTQRRRVVASTNQRPPNWLLLATTKPRKVGLIACGRENICGATSLNPSTWSESHPTWSNCSKQQSGGPTDCRLLQLKHVECISLLVNKSTLVTRWTCFDCTEMGGSLDRWFPVYLQRNVSALVHSPWVALKKRPVSDSLGCGSFSATCLAGTQTKGIHFAPIQVWWTDTQGLVQLHDWALPDRGHQKLFTQTRTLGRTGMASPKRVVGKDEVSLW